MVQAIININQHANYILNIIKAKFALKDKSQAIEIMAKQYEEEILEPQLRPEYIEKLKHLTAQKGTTYKSIADLRRQIEKVGF